MASLQSGDMLTVSSLDDIMMETLHLQGDCRPWHLASVNGPRRALLLPCLCLQFSSSPLPSKVTLTSGTHPRQGQTVGTWDREGPPWPLDACMWPTPGNPVLTGATRRVSSPRVHRPTPRAGTHHTVGLLLGSFFAASVVKDTPHPQLSESYQGHHMGKGKPP